jgi:hypothetical protein
MQQIQVAMRRQPYLTQTQSNTQYILDIYYIILFVENFK